MNLLNNPFRIGLAIFIFRQLFYAIGMLLFSSVGLLVPLLLGLMYGKKFKYQASHGFRLRVSLTDTTLLAFFITLLILWEYTVTKNVRTPLYMYIFTIFMVFILDYVGFYLGNRFALWGRGNNDNT